MFLQRFLLLILLIPSLIGALSVGNIKVASHLYQPLQASIPLSHLGDIRSDEIQVQLASAAEFEKAGMVKTNVLRALSFHVLHAQSLNPSIKITSVTRINDPYVSFLLKVSWAKGDYIKKYTLLLNPVTAPPAKPPSIAIKTQQHQVARISNGIFGPTIKSDTLWQIAQQLRDNRALSMDQIMLALVQYNPQAFLLNNANGLMSGFYLKVPTVTQFRATPAHKALLEMQKHNQHWKKYTRVALEIKATPVPVTAPPLQQAQRPPVAAKDKPKNIQALATTPVIAKTQSLPPVKKVIQPEEGASIQMPVTPAAALTHRPLPVKKGEGPDETFSIETPVAIKTLQAQLDAAVIENQAIKNSNQTLLQRLQEIQQQNQFLEQELTGSKETIVRLQNLSQTPASQVANRDSSISTVVTTMINYAWQILIGLLLIILLIIWLRIRRKRRQQPIPPIPPRGTAKQEVHSKVKVPQELHDPSLDIESKVDTSPDNSASEKNMQGKAEQNIKIEELLPEVTIKEVHRKNPMIDKDVFSGDVQSLFDEAKLYIDYGRQEQAKLLLQKASENMPADTGKWQQLLKITASLHDKKIFGQVVAKIPSELLTGKDMSLWESVQELRAGLIDCDNSDIELAGESSTENMKSVPNDQNIEVPANKNDQEPLDLTLKHDNAVYDRLLDINIEQASTEHEDDINIIAGEVANASKLDLARAYIEMGAINKAKNLLVPLTKVAKADEKAKAQKMLADLNS